MKKAPSPRSTLPAADSYLAVPNPTKDSAPVSPSKPRSVEPQPSSDVRRLVLRGFRLSSSLCTSVRLHCHAVRCASSGVT